MTSNDNASAPAELVKQDGPNTLNDFVWVAGQNLPNHTESVQGRGKFVAAAAVSHAHPMLFRNKQDAFRCAAWLIEIADAHLPNDRTQVYTFEEVRDAIRNA